MITHYFISMFSNCHHGGTKAWRILCQPPQAKMGFISSVFLPQTTTLYLYAGLLASFCNLPSTFDNAALSEVYIVLSTVDCRELQIVQILLRNSSIAAITAVSQYFELNRVLRNKKHLFNFRYKIPLLFNRTYMILE